MSRDTWRRVWLSIEWFNSSWKGGERLPPSVPLKGYTMLYGYGLYGYCVSCVSCAAIVVCLHEQKATVFGEEMSLPKNFRACGAQKKAKKIFAGLRPAPLRPPSRKIMTARPGPPVAAPGAATHARARPLGPPPAHPPALPAPWLAPESPPRSMCGPGDDAPSRAPPPHPMTAASAW